MHHCIYQRCNACTDTGNLPRSLGRSAFGSHRAVGRIGDYGLSPDSGTRLGDHALRASLQAGDVLVAGRGRSLRTR